jgi:hypothetical protein
VFVAVNRRALSALLASVSLVIAGAIGLVIAPAARATGTADIQITEFAYGGLTSGGVSGTDGEYIELTNVGDGAQDFAGWHYNTANSVTGAIDLSGFGTVAAGESVIITDLTQAEFRTEWGLKSSVKVITDGSVNLNKGPKTIFILDGSNTVADQLSYASGYLSTKGIAAFVNPGQLAVTDTATVGGWTITASATADAESSWTSAHGAVGSPGASTQGTETPADVRTQAKIRITEFAYGGKVSGSTTGGDGEYAELTNIGDASQDLTGWAYETGVTATAATGLSLTSLGTVAPGESVIVTDVTAAEFRTEWNVKSSVPVLSNNKTHTLNGGPNGIHIFNSSGTEVDSVTYAASFESTKGVAAWVDAAHVGAKADTTGWTIAAANDTESSWTSAGGAIGSPGASTLGTETPADVRVPATPLISVTPATGVTDGAAVTVNGSGFQPSESVNILQCSVATPSDTSTQCNLSGLVNLTTDGTGALSAQLTVHSTDGTFVFAAAANASEAAPAFTIGFAVTTDPNYADIVINEITSDNDTNGFAPLDADDLIELYNKGTHDVSLAGWKQTDSNANGFASATDFSTGLYVNDVLSTTIPAGGYGVFSSGPGLSSGGDAVKIYTPGGTLVDSLTYTAGQAGVDEGVNTDHIYKSLAACPDGSDTFLEVTAHSFGQSNASACESGVTPLSPGSSTPEAPCQTENSGTDPGTVPAGAVTWLGSDTPTTVDPQCYWDTSAISGGSGQDLSGLAFDPQDANVLYAVKNKEHVYRLVKTSGSWAKDTANGWSDGKEIRFPGSTGLPDSEGLTVGPDGDLYITTERDNANSGTPLDSILKFDPAAAGTTLTASDQWALTSDLGFTNADANLGFEGVAYVPDSYLTANGFIDDNKGHAYNPADYSTKVTAGLFFAAVEKTGHLLAYELNADHTFARVADISTGMAGVMDASYDPDLKRIWAHCDNTCGNTTALLKIGSNGHFAVDQYYNPPANLPNYNLEGFAVAPVSTATNGEREVLWTDDGNRFGHSLWSGAIDVNILAQSSTPSPVVSGTGVFGAQLTATIGTWDSGVTTHYQWKDGSTVLGSDSPLTLSDPALVGKTITLSVTGTKSLYVDVTKTATISVAPATQTAQPTPVIGGSAVVGGTLTATVGTWDAGFTTHYQWKDGTTVLTSDSALPVTAGLVGKTITLSVTGTKAGYADVTKTATAVIASGTLAKQTPTISGTGKVGSTLTAAVAQWGPGTVSLSYQWLANGSPIAAATGTSLKLTGTLLGKKITVKVTGAESGYTTDSATSSGVTVKTGAMTVPTPKITGTAKVGKKLTAKPGAWKAGSAKVVFKYQWLAGGKTIKGATKSSFTLAKGQKGKKITVKVTGSATGYTTVAKTSKATKPVK